MTPEQRHNGQEYKILASRKIIYAAAKDRNPERWTGEIRNWEPVKEVRLNPDKNGSSEDKIIEEAA